MSPERSELARYAAPAAFLIAATVAILLVRGSLHDDAGQPASTAGATTATVSSRAVRPGARGTVSTTTATATAEFHTVASGDTYGALAAKYDTSVDHLRELNPGVDPDALSVGTKIRVR